MKWLSQTSPSLATSALWKCCRWFASFRKTLLSEKASSRCSIKKIFLKNIFKINRKKIYVRASFLIKSKVVDEPFKCQPNKMVKHTRTICWQKPKNYLSVSDNFAGLALKGLKGNSGAVFSVSFPKFLRTIIF